MLLLLVLAAPAQATVAPNDRVAAIRSTIAEDAIMYDGPIGAMLEKDYFRAARFDGERACGPLWLLPHRADRFIRSCE
jgi:hypothetical protein